MYLVDMVVFVVKVDDECCDDASALLVMVVFDVFGEENGMN
jgi:hypothetical protein